MLPARPCLLGMLSGHKHKHGIWKESGEAISPKRYSPWHLASWFEAVGLVTEARKSPLFSFLPPPLPPPLSLLHLFTIYVRAYLHVPPIAHMWGWEDNLCDSVLSFHVWILGLELGSWGVAAVLTCSVTLLISFLNPFSSFPPLSLSLLCISLHGEAPMEKQGMEDTNVFLFLLYWVT